MTTNQIQFQNLMETRRANQAREQEAHRSNLAQEMLSSRGLDLKTAESERAEELLPYQKWVQGTQAAKNITGGIADITKSGQTVLSGGLTLQQLFPQLIPFL